MRENIYDILHQRKHVLTHNNNKVIRVSRKGYKNKLYFFDNYSKNKKQRALIWITDDDIIIQISTGLIDLIVETVGFIEIIRKLKTADKINNYILFLKL